MSVNGPEGLMQLMQGAQVCGLFKSSIELGVYEKLAAGAKSASEVARAIDCPERSTRILLDALAVLGLVEKSGDGYALAPTSRMFLVPGMPTYLGEMVQVFASDMMWNGAHRFTDAVRKGGTVLDAHAETPGNSFWETFARVTGALAVPGGMALDGLLDGWLRDRAEVRVLDVAAGSGLYGFVLAKRPNVKLTALDWPNVLEETKKQAARFGVDAARVRYLPGNLFEADYQGPYDLILLSHVYHHFDPPTCEALTKRVAAALAPGGRVAIHDLLYDAELKNPMGALFSTTMLLWTRKGEAYSAEQYQGWLRSAGLTPSGVYPSQRMPSSYLFGDK